MPASRRRPGQTSQRGAWTKLEPGAGADFQLALLLLVTANLCFCFEGQAMPVLDICTVRRALLSLVPAVPGFTPPSAMKDTALLLK
ncbi:hypothetical protein VTK26DRAFT_3389 [Humicola hyalothermophila]